MALQFSLDEQEDLLKIPTNSPEAYSLFLRAWNTGGIGVQDDTLLDEAIALDPNFAQAHALKALINSRRLIDIAGIHGADATTRDEIAALVERHAEAIEQAQLGIDLNPLSANAFYYLAVTNAYAGDYDGSLAALRRAQTYLAIGDDEQAIEWLESVAEKAANHIICIQSHRGILSNNRIEGACSTRCGSDRVESGAKTENKWLNSRGAICWSCSQPVRNSGPTRSPVRSASAAWARSGARDTNLKRDVALKVLPAARLFLRPSADRRSAA